MSNFELVCTMLLHQYHHYYPFVKLFMPLFPAAYSFVFDVWRDKKLRMIALHQLIMRMNLHVYQIFVRLNGLRCHSNNFFIFFFSGWWKYWACKKMIWPCWMLYPVVKEHAGLQRLWKVSEQTQAASVFQIIRTTHVHWCKRFYEYLGHRVDTKTVMCLVKNHFRCKKWS